MQRVNEVKLNNCFLSIFVQQNGRFINYNEKTHIQKHENNRLDGQKLFADDKKNRNVMGRLPYVHSKGNKFLSSALYAKKQTY